MSALTTKSLTMKNPTMPTTDAVANWDRLRPVLVGIANPLPSERVVPSSARLRWGDVVSPRT